MQNYYLYENKTMKLQMDKNRGELLIKFCFLKSLCRLDIL